MKAARHAMILDLIANNCVETQDELTNLLKRNDFIVTQATVSRDMKELRLLKVLTENGKYKYATVDKAEASFADRFLRIFANSVLSIGSAGNIVVIKTISGSANAAAEAIDSLKWPEIAGSIAGDNTIFVAISDACPMHEIIGKFQALIR